MHTISCSFGCRHFQALATVFILAIFSFGAPPDGSAGARLVIDAAERERWYGEDNLYGEAYGKHIAMDTGRMVTAGDFNAVVWEYDYTGGWQPVQLLEPGIGRIEDVAIHGEWIVFGAPLSIYPIGSPIDGRVAMFRNTGAGGWVPYASWWQPENTVTGYEVHSYGSSVDIEGETLVVSAPDSRDIESPYDDGPGFVFVYTWNGSDWVYADYITSDDGDPWRFFGASVDLEGGRLIVGGPRDPDYAGIGQFGAAFIFEGAGASWSHVRTVAPITTDGDVNDYHFARHVANDRGLFLMVAADGGVKIIIEAGLGHYEEQVVNLPGRQVAIYTDGADFDLERGLYVDSTNGAVVSIQPEGGTWQVTDAWQFGDILSPAGLTTAPFGVAIHGYYAAVGYPQADIAGPNTGAVVPYVRSSPGGSIDVDPPILVYGDAQPGDGFGLAVAAQDTGGGNARAIVGAPNDTGGIGAAYLYTYDSLGDEWTKSSRWQPEELNAGAGFGTSVACNGLGGYAAGAPDETVATERRGAVYVYHPGEGMVRLTGPIADEGFGHAIAYSGDLLAVGAPAAVVNNVETGVIYISEYSAGSGWSDPAGLVATGLTSFAQLGAAMATDGQWLVAGAPGDQAGGVDAGAAMVYEYTGGSWSSGTPLVPPILAPGDRFGTAVAVFGNMAFVSAPGDDTAGNGAGAVHRFEWNGSSWTHMARYVAPDAQPGDGFGSSLYLDQRNLFVGAPGVDAGATDTGANYAFRLSNGIWVAAANRITHIGPVADDHAGQRVAFVNGMLLAGAPGVDDAGDNAGAVIVFDYTTKIEVPSPLNPGPGGTPCQGDFEIDFEQTFISPLDPAGGDSFGQVVDLSGDAMIVSEPWADYDYIDRFGNPQTGRLGAVHVYRRTDINQWILEQTLQPPLEDVVPSLKIGNFGHMAAISGDWLVVGNWYGRMVHVYQRTIAGWMLQARLLPADSSVNTFGNYGLDISGTTVMVGEHGYSIPSVMSAVGRVYFFEYNPASDLWDLNGGAPIISSEAHFSQNFGQSVAVNADAGRAVATGDNQSDPSFRNAYVFTRSGGLWQESAILRGEIHGATSWFGWEALDISGDTVVVGDSYFSGPTSQSGAVFVWTHDGSAWTGPAILFSSLPVFQSGFGNSVAIDGDLLAVGAPHDYDHLPFGSRPGIAYVFGRDSGVWTERLRIVPPDLTLHQFGIQTAVNDGIVAAGTPRRRQTYDGLVVAYDMDCQGYCPGDFDLDGDVDGSDLAVIAAEMGTIGCNTVSPCQADLDNNGVVGPNDMRIFLAKFGRTNCH